MSDWTRRAACVRRPADWWDFGDGGNRLALMICSICPVQQECAREDPEPAGVVRAGVAWTDAGNPAEICPCGYPVVPKPGPRQVVATCSTCTVPKVPIPPRRRGHKPGTPPGHIVRHLSTIRQMADDGYGDNDIARRIGCTPRGVRNVRSKHRISGRATTPA